MSGYLLAVDLGTTYSAAAVCHDGHIEIFDLGSESATIPSIVALRADGTLLTGEAAARRALAEPARAAREFKRRLGDPVPIVLGGTPYGAEALTGHLLRSIVERVTEQHGEPPERVVLSHPAGYGPYKLDLLIEAARLAGLEHVDLVTEPEATAVHYSASERLEPGSLVAVYDFGGGTFDAAVVRKVDDRFELLGSPAGMERFGGIDLDEAVLAHVRDALGGVVEQLDPTDPAVPQALGRLREECRTAKEALSADTDATIPVLLPTAHTEVRLTRSELEDMIRPRLRETLDVLERAVHSAGVDFADLTSVLLVGGSSRIPLVAEMVRSETRRPVAVDVHPKHAIALGAAAAGWAGATSGPRETPAIDDAEAEPSPLTAEAVVAEEQAEPADVAPAARPPAAQDRARVAEPAAEQPGPAVPRHRAWRRPPVVLALAGLIVAVAVVAGVVAFSGGDGDEPEAGDEPTPDDEPVPNDGPAGSDLPPVVGDEPSPRVVATYEIGYAEPGMSGTWGSWAPEGAGPFDPPEDVASDFHPLLGPYDSNDPGVVAQHFAWFREAGVGIAAVSWPGPGGPGDEVIPIVLEMAERYGIQVAFTLVAADPRAPESVLEALGHLGDLLRDHPAIARDPAPSRWSPDDQPKALIFVASPEAAGPEAEPVPIDAWAGVLDEARLIADLRVMAIGTEPALIEGGHFDGLVGPARPDTGYGWAMEAPADAWIAPVVEPGRSATRLGEPIDPVDRRDGSEYEEQWRAVEGLGVEPAMVVISSFNNWNTGTQIEPASPEPPERADGPYFDYGPSPVFYLEITRVLIAEILGAR